MFVKKLLTKNVLFFIVRRKSFMDILTLGESGEGVLIRLNDSPISIPAKTPGVAFLAPEGQAEVRNLLCFTSDLWLWLPSVFRTRRLLCVVAGSPSQGRAFGDPPQFPSTYCWRIGPRHTSAFLGGPILADPGSHPCRPDAWGHRARRALSPPLYGGTNAYGARFFVGVRRVYRPLPLLTRTSIIGSPYWEALQPRPPTLFVDVDGNGRKNLLLSPFLLVRQKTYYNIK